jgi:hypothetical protein
MNIRKICALLFLLFITFYSQAQKQISEYSISELQEKKNEAVANNNADNAAVYTKALEIRSQMDAAVKAEDYAKAGSLKEQLKSLKVLSAQDNEKIKALEAEIKVAVAEEKYDRAAALKNDIENIRGVKTPTSPEQTGNKTVSASSSIPSIEFVNQVYFWNKNDNSIKTLEYNTPEIKTQTNVGFGYAQATSFWAIPGTKSDVILTSEANTSFIIKVSPGVNPIDLFRLVRFEILGKVNPCRHMAAYTSTSAAYTGGSTNERRDNDIAISFQKLDDAGNYEVVVNGRLSPGEYTFFGLGKMYSFSLQNTYSNNTQLQKNQSLSSASTSYTKRDIYSEANITWFGVDFSLFNYVFERKSNAEEALAPHIPKLQKHYAADIPSSKFMHWMAKNSFMNDKEYAESLYKTHINPDWITGIPRTVNESDIQNHLMNYKSGLKGIGLVLLPEEFNQDRANYTVEFVWFDIETKAVIHSQKIIEKGAPHGGLASWDPILVDATKTYIDKFYKREKGF